MPCIYLHFCSTVLVHVLVIALVSRILLACICVLNCLLDTLLPCGCLAAALSRRSPSSASLQMHQPVILHASGSLRVTGMVIEIRITLLQVQCNDGCCYVLCRHDTQLTNRMCILSRWRAVCFPICSALMLGDAYNLPDLLLRQAEATILSLILSL